jgi:hypothetical protein
MVKLRSSAALRRSKGSYAVLAVRKLKKELNPVVLMNRFSQVSYMFLFEVEYISNTTDFAS